MDATYADITAFMSAQTNGLADIESTFAAKLIDDASVPASPLVCRWI